MNSISPFTRPIPSTLVQLKTLIFIQLTNIRWFWKRSIVVSTIFPILTLVLLGSFSDKSYEAKVFIISGNVVLSLLFETVVKVSGRFSYMKMVGMLDYLASLPIYKFAIMVATLLSFFLLSIPSLLAIIVIGIVLFDIALSLNPMVLLIIPLISISLCGIGVIIGVTAKNPPDATSYCNLTTFLLLGFGPVIIPPNLLPPFIQQLSYLSPVTYAASALRQTLFGLPDRIPLHIDLLMLILFAILSTWISIRLVDWRVK